MKKTLARWGAVGGTARWVAESFMKAIPLIDLDNLEKSEQGKNEELKKIVDFCLEVRPFISQNEIDEVKKTYNSLNPGMVSFTKSLLGVEAGFFKNSHQNQLMFEEVIREELINKGVGNTML